MSKKISEIKIGWKVCRTNDKGDLRSAVHSCAIDYNQTGWIRPHRGQNQFIFVFKTQKDAEAFKADRPRANEYAILKVEVKGPSEQGRIYGTRNFLKADALNFPDGTFFAKAVKVLGRVYTAYKVVCEVETTLTLSSAVQRTEAGRQPIKYQLNRWVKPPKNANQFLFVFEYLSDARDFCGECSHYHLYKADVLGLTNQEIDRNGQLFENGNFPKGTRFTKSVKLVEKIN